MALVVIVIVVVNIRQSRRTKALKLMLRVAQRQLASNCSETGSRLRHCHMHVESLCTGLSVRHCAVVLSQQGEICKGGCLLRQRHVLFHTYPYYHTIRQSHCYNLNRHHDHQRKNTHRTPRWYSKCGITALLNESITGLLLYKELLHCSRSDLK